MSTNKALAVFSIFLLAPFSIAHPTPGHDHVERGGLLSAIGSSWYHPEGHHSEYLFKRQLSDSNGTNPAVGSDAWNNMWPGYDTPDPTQMPTLWMQALTNAENAGLIPNIPPSVNGVYPAGTNPVDPSVCSSYEQCQAPGDIWNAPDGMLGVSFDDGPTLYSPPLYAFLKEQGQIATHFYIGVNIKGNPDIFMQAYNQSDDIACHTWSHPMMTTLTNAQVVAELGYTQQMISDLTGGRIPKFWRPPYGDSDNRIRAIATHIFGLTQVNWNQDTDDWQVGTGGVTPATINASLTQFINGPKSPGLIILEHELYAATVQAFIDAYPLIKSTGWVTKSIPDLFSLPFYQNSQNDNSTVYALNLIVNATATIPGLPTSGATSATSSATQTTGAAGATTTGAGTSSASTSTKKSAGLIRYRVDGTVTWLLAALIAVLAFA